MASAVSDADYVCTLNDKSAKKAKDELNEDPKDRLGSVQKFRELVLQQPHIKCPTDISFLLTFLRVRYFSQLEARKLLDNFVTRRTKFPQWFKNLDPADPKIQDVFDRGFLLLLPEKDDEGRQVYIIRPGYLDSKGEKNRPEKRDVFRAFACVIDYMYFCDENTTVNGTVGIFDAAHYSLKMQAFISMEERRDFIQTWQANYPARVKALHMYNAGTVADLLMTVVKFCMSEKMQQRMKIHGQSLESLYKDVPMRLLPVEYLPDDYKGPNAGTEKEIIERMKTQLLKPEIRDRIKYLSSDQFGVDEKKRPAAEDVTQASFRKLNID